ncbi:hypothetical protein BGZ68_006137 [Mortierella alpina]|nr:hypothetical protein BGZ68_006137 [Mortierella alpina]
MRTYLRLTGISLMALQELDGYEDDYVFLSDIENEDYAPRIESIKTAPIDSSASQRQRQRHRQPTRSTGLEADDDEVSDLDDVEEIEYGYDNDTLLIMPAMLRDYSHHATNYHPELWRGPNPDGRSSLARCRQEARSFALGSTSNCAEDIHTSSTAVGSSASTSSTSAAPPSPASSNPFGASVATMNTATPSVSSRDIGIVMDCDHGLCLSCLQSFLTNAATQNQARFPTLCPQPGCRTPIPTESAELVLDPETLEIWYRKLAEIYVANKVCCPRPECRSIIDLDDRDGTAVTCPECKSSFCAACAVPFHRGKV